MLQIVYNISIRLYLLAIYIAAAFNSKARLWIKGRRNILKKIGESINIEDRIIWFHAASLGEFEQGRPVIEEIKKRQPEYKILLTFFSPSGYEIRKNYEGADYIFYLPMDTPRNAWNFVRIVEPEIVFFIKYEFWFNYIRFLGMNDIPVYFISVIFRRNQHFFKRWGFWFRKRLKNITWFFVQNKGSFELLDSIDIQNKSLSSDTRIDRVWAVSQMRKPFPLVETFAQSQPVLLTGSSWPPDEDLLIKFINQNPGRYRYIIAPHEIHPERIDDFAGKVNAKCLKYSEANEENIEKAEVLFIDSIGILLHLYQYSKAAYIGGGFGKNIHNILEAATFGKPVLFGPNYHKFQEAHDLLELGGAFCIHDFEEFSRKATELLNDESTYRKASDICSSYVERKRGATEQILKKVFEEDPL